MDYIELVKFLAALKKNNNKEWFEKNRPRYEGLRKEFLEFVTAVMMGLLEFDPSLANIDPKHCIFRINKDIRFSKDKSPYKTQFAAAMSPDGKSGNSPLYYMHIDYKGDLIVAGGVYQPDNEILKKIRYYISGYPDKVDALLKDKKIKSRFKTIEGEQLKRFPKGYDELVSHPDLIRKKSYILEETLKISEVNPKTVIKRIKEDFEIMHPFIVWLRESLSANI